MHTYLLIINYLWTKCYNQKYDKFKQRVIYKGTNKWRGYYTYQYRCTQWRRILQSFDVKSWLTGKDPDARKDWGQEQKQATDNEMVGRHHQFNGHEFEQTLEDSEGQGNLACWRLWGQKESDTTEWLNNN